MNKGEFLAYWQGIEEGQAVRPVPVAYKHEGSTFDEDGIRLTGSAAFIESVLSRVKDLLNYEAGGTRLQVSYGEAVDKDSGLPLGSYRCYVQVHERGREARIANGIFGSVYDRELGREAKVGS